MPIEATLRLAAATLAQEVKASRQNVGKYLLGLADDVLRKAQASAGVPSGWQPIESAPKDGTRVLVFTDQRVTAVASWAYGHQILGYVRPEQWGWRSGRDTFLNPTHWMPLPQPPECFDVDGGQNSQQQTVQPANTD